MPQPCRDPAFGFRRWKRWFFYFSLERAQPLYGLLSVTQSRQETDLCSETVARETSLSHFRVHRWQYVVTRTSWMIGNRAFSVATPHAWNRLPTELKRLHCTSAFRRKLMTVLFQSSYVSDAIISDGKSVCLFVRLSVCLSAGLLKKLWTDFDEFLER